MTMEEKFFQKEFFFSYSGLNKLLFSPRLWYKHYVLQEREERTDNHLIEGKVIHALLLDEANFSKNFMILPGNIPTGNTRMVVDKVFEKTKNNEDVPTPDKLNRYKSDIVETLKEMDLHQSLTDDKKTGVTGDEKRIAKIINDETESYWDFLKNKEGKDIIDMDTLTRCREGAELLKANDRISDLLKIGNTNKKITVYNEQPIARNNFAGLPFGLKGILDNYVVDDENKIVYVNDIKTTGKTIEDFQETVEYYNYWIQAAIYKLLLSDMIQPGYKFKFTFIVIDKYQQVYPFEVSTVTINTWEVKLKEVLEKAKWHYTNRKFNLPHRFETETVTL
jgi:hypothetical protein